MKRLRWQLLIIIITGAVVGILLLGQKQPTPQTVIVPEPAQGGIYVEGLIGSLQRLNPLLDANHPVDRDIDRLLFSGLLRFDSRGLPQTDLAESWAVSQDGTVYNFSIRKEAKWHDGEPVKASDILFTIDLLRSDESFTAEDMRTFWNQVEVRVQDDSTIQFRLAEPFAPFLDFLTFGILPQHLLQGLSFTEMIDARFNMEPVGSGPYRFHSLIVEANQITGVILDANNEYFGKKPFIEQVVFRFFADAQSMLAAYQEGEIQGLGSVPNEILQPVLAEPNLLLHTGRLPQQTLILFNLNDPQLPFFQEIEIRRALLTGLNRQRMIDQILNGQAILADGPILPGNWAYIETQSPIEYSQETALNIIKNAGYTLQPGESIRSNEGRQFSFELLYPDDDLHARLAQAIQRDWQNLGIGVTIVPIEYEALVKEYLEPRTFQAALVDLNLSRSPDPDPYPFWDQAQSTGGQNYSQWNNVAASEALELARVTVDLEERARLYHNFQVIWQKELPALPLFFPVYTYAIDQSVQGVQIGPIYSPSDRFTTISEWFLVAQKAPAVVAPTATP